MNNLLLILAVLPSIVLGWFIYKKDKFGKEPVELLIKLFIGGVGAIALTLIFSKFAVGISPLLDSSKSKNEIELIWGVFIGIALIEEFSKWFFLKTRTWKHKEFDHIYDAIVYAVFVTLGFATLENIMYIFDSKSLQIAILRAVVSVPGHVFDAILMGAFYGEAKRNKVNKNNSKVMINLFLSILIPTICHGYFDYLLYLKSPRALFLFFPYVGILYVICFIVVSKIAKTQYNFEDLICPKCNIASKYEYCKTCGSRLK